MVPLTRPWLGDPERSLMEEVTESGMLVQGKKVAAFEAAVAAFTSRKHVAAVMNGTAAIELGLRALGVGPGDDVLCPALSWPSPAHAIRVLGARPVLVDVDESTWNVTKDACRRAMTGKVKVAIVIDQFGFPADAAGIKEECGVDLLVDAACSLGSTVNGAPALGRGIIATTSFHPRKVITTGEGGMCLTDDDALGARLRVLRNHGIDDQRRFVEASGNYRMSDLSAAMGVGQMGRLDEILSKRRARAAAYREAFKDETAFSWQGILPGTNPNYQTMGAVLAPQKTAEDRDQLVSKLRELSVQASILSYALSRLASVDASEPCPVAESVVDRGFAIPLFPQMTDQQHQEVIHALRQAIQ